MGSNTLLDLRFPPKYPDPITISHHVTKRVGFDFDRVLPLDTNLKGPSLVTCPGIRAVRGCWKVGLSAPGSGVGKIPPSSSIPAGISDNATKTESHQSRLLTVPKQWPVLSPASHRQNIRNETADGPIQPKGVSSRDQIIPKSPQISGIRQMS